MRGMRILCPNNDEKGGTRGNSQGSTNSGNIAFRATCDRFLGVAVAFPILRSIMLVGTQREESIFQEFLASSVYLIVTTREYVVVHVLREAYKICIAMSVTLGIAAVQKSSEDTLIGAELVPKMLWLVYFKIKRAFRILRVLKKQSDKILYGFALL